MRWAKPLDAEDLPVKQLLLGMAAVVVLAALLVLWAVNREPTPLAGRVDPVERHDRFTLTCVSDDGQRQWTVVDSRHPPSSQFAGRICGLADPQRPTPTPTKEAP